MVLTDVFVLDLTVPLVMVPDAQLVILDILLEVVLVILVMMLTV